jgi:hypothetical protein
VIARYFTVWPPPPLWPPCLRALSGSHRDCR